MPKRLTEPQQQLLDEIRNSATGGLLIRDFSRYTKTAAALVRHELVSKKWEHDDWYWYEPVTDQGAATSLLAGMPLLVSYVHVR